MSVEVLDAAQMGVGFISSAQFPNVFVRMDGRNVTRFNPAGSGKVNCQYGAASFETFRLVPHPDNDGTVAFASTAFRNVFLRMDGSKVTKFSASGAGTVDCQYGAGPWEKFRIEPHPDNDGTVAIASVAFRHVYLRLDGTGIHSFHEGGSGTVNCQWGAQSFEKFRVLTDDGGRWALRMTDVEAAFNAVPDHGELEQFSSSDSIVNLLGDHLQGMSAYGHYFLLAKSESTGDRGTMIVMNRTSHEVPYTFPTPVSGYPHPDGGQVIGRFLAQAIENDSHGRVVFYDLQGMSDQNKPRQLPAILVPSAGAGAVGITDTGSGPARRYVVAVYTDGGVTIYKSNGEPLDGPACKFAAIGPARKLPPFHGDDSSKGADNIALVTDVTGQVWLVGFTSTENFIGGPDEDWAGLYKVDMGTGALTPVIQRHMYTESGPHIPVLGGVAFRWGAGLTVVTPSTLQLFCSARNFIGGLTATVAINTFGD